MKNFAYSFLILLISMILYGQEGQFSNVGNNLILNPDFEKIEIDNIDSSGENLKFKNWFTSYYSTPDCYTNPDSLKLFYRFRQIKKAPPPYSGNCYIGFVPISWDDYFETIVGEFSKPLVEGKKYEIGFFIRHASDSLFFRLKELEAVVSTERFTDNQKLSPDFSGFMVNSDTKIKSDIKFSTYMVDDKSWKYVNNIYLAKGGERFITFGIFYNKWLFNNIGRHGRLVKPSTNRSYIDFGNPIFIEKEDFYRKKDKVLFMGPNSENLITLDEAFSYYFIDYVVVREIE